MPQIDEKAQHRCSDQTEVIGHRPHRKHGQQATQQRQSNGCLRITVIRTAGFRNSGNQVGPIPPALDHAFDHFRRMPKVGGHHDGSPAATTGMVETGEYGGTATEGTGEHQEGHGDSLSPLPVMVLKRPHLLDGAIDGTVVDQHQSLDIRNGKHPFDHIGDHGLGIGHGGDHTHLPVSPWLCGMDQPQL